MRANRLIGVFFILFCAVSWFYLIPTFIKGEEQAVYPRLVLLFLLLPALGLLLRSGDVVVAAGTPSRPDPMTFMLIALYLAYLYGVQRVGFFVASFVCAVLFLLLFGERRPLMLFCVPTGLLLGIHLVIERFLHFPLPVGFLF